MAATGVRQAARSRARPAWTWAPVLAWALCGPALALDLPQPWRLVAETALDRASYRLPVAPWTDQGLTVRSLDGRVARTVWQRELGGASTLALLAPLRAALDAEGFTPVFQCETEGCGGFDFRYATDVEPEPEMHVDLGDFRFYAALRETPSGTEAVSLIVSRSAATGFAQMIRVSAAPPEPAPPESAPPPVQETEDHPEPGPQVTASTKSPDPALVGPRLEAGGSVVLEDLVFASGSSRLEDRSYPDLAQLADWLKADPARKVVIVGHTDASGSLAANVAVSRDRAASVRDRLLSQLGVAAEQVTAEGVGYLAPRDTNLTDEGRARNRRVEVMLSAG